MNSRKNNKIRTKHSILGRVGKSNREISSLEKEIRELNRKKYEQAEIQIKRLEAGEYDEMVNSRAVQEALHSELQVSTLEILERKERLRRMKRVRQANLVIVDKIKEDEES